MYCLFYFVTIFLHYLVISPFAGLEKKLNNSLTI